MPQTGSGGSSRQDDRLLDCLDDLERAAGDVQKAVTMLTARAAGMRASRQQGVSWRQIVEAEERPLIAEMLTATIQEFEATGTRFRQAKARVLHDEGMTMEQIAALFGVSRQRISVLLRAT
jgi:hypothetical protein